MNRAVGRRTAEPMRLTLAMNAPGDEVLRLAHAARSAGRPPGETTYKLSPEDFIAARFAWADRMLTAAGGCAPHTEEDTL